MGAKKLVVERKDEGNHTLITLKGTIDEEADFREVFSNLKPNVIVNLEEIRMINSCGVREWINTVTKIPTTSAIRFDRCAPRIVEQINYVANFLGSGEVTSFYAPYFCVKCKAEVNVLLNVKDLIKNKPVRAPEQRCPTCKGPLEFDDIEEEYFSFLGEE